MKRLLVIATFVLALVPSVSTAVELKNIRPSYGPLGATRYDTNLLPGDVLFMTYDIEGLGVDPKTGKTSYVTILELLDANEKVLFKENTPNDVVPQLGGNRMPGDLHVIMGPKQAPGKYFVRLSVHDKIGNDAKAFKFPFNVLPAGFGMVGVSAPSVGFTGQHYVAGFAVVNMALDAKKQPNVEVNIRLLDERGSIASPAVQMILPRDLPKEQPGKESDLEKTNFVPLNYPVYLNRVGRYTMEIVAEDKSAGKQTKMSYSFSVIDVSTFIGK